MNSYCVFLFLNRIYILILELIEFNQSWTHKQCISNKIDLEYYLDSVEDKNNRWKLWLEKQNDHRKYNISSNRVNELIKEVKNSIHILHDQYISLHNKIEMDKKNSRICLNNYIYKKSQELLLEYDSLKETETVINDLNILIEELNHSQIGNKDVELWRADKKLQINNKLKILTIEKIAVLEKQKLDKIEKEEKKLYKNMSKDLTLKSQLRKNKRNKLKELILLSNIKHLNCIKQNNYTYKSYNYKSKIWVNNIGNWYHDQDIKPEDILVKNILEEKINKEFMYDNKLINLAPFLCIILVIHYSSIYNTDLTYLFPEYIEYKDFYKKISFENNILIRYSDLENHNINNFYKNKKYNYVYI